MNRLKKISVKTLAKLVNEALRKPAGYEFSFAEFMNGDEPHGWHTCTRNDNNEVIVRYNGGVCFGLITDTNVSTEDMHTYLDSACQYGKCDYVFLEVEDEMDDDLDEVLEWCENEDNDSATPLHNLVELMERYLPKEEFDAVFSKIAQGMRQ